MIIAVDFDGTCVEHDYPRIGKDVPDCVRVLKKLVAMNWSIILYTMRSDHHLQDAIDWFKKHEIPLWGVNENLQQKDWTTSPKVYAHIYVDDAALGCPLINQGPEKRPYVDWVSVERMLVADWF